ncbi:hypothetical protein LZ30DRAFT_221420 [Colletotrichum cereale]|nr:hypothetical protein LZ30DRAFT_221420 [Colletotrichum cereale]
MKPSNCPIFPAVKPCFFPLASPPHGLPPPPPPPRPHINYRKLRLEVAPLVASSFRPHSTPHAIITRLHVSPPAGKCPPSPIGPVDTRGERVGNMAAHPRERLAAIDPRHRGQRTRPPGRGHMFHPHARPPFLILILLLHHRRLSCQVPAPYPREHRRASSPYSCQAPSPCPPLPSLDHV